jgi:hypothetical protein
MGSFPALGAGIGYGMQVSESFPAPAFFFTGKVKYFADTLLY